MAQRSFMRRSVSLVVVLSLGAVFAGTCAAQSGHFAYPPYGAQRGRMVYRDGLFHSERYRWGNGLTPQGAQVLTHAIDVAGPLVPMILTGSAGRGEESSRDSRDEESRSRDSFSNCSEYAYEQRRANDLLVRTARLLDPSFSDTDTVPPPEKSDPKAGLTKEQLLKLYNALGANPWSELAPKQEITPPAPGNGGAGIDDLRRLYKAPKENPWKTNPN